ncbi:TetR/AcrR family transcriptional regulator [Undibacterium sp. CY18W]|uniref:TetR/AcrR family transcriptional regulator n=1 Tax=Undibacterium hunanense TaxID=2762292 RepID=A0ABR6ZJC7_9BURK|nr:TetR/AcrR family transcriptional regulator [Undibacterium hunanense]MBC3915956.1 TetR/AcrR family transcriptional regulator [Undibacterium hunanense]
MTTATATGDATQQSQPPAKKRGRPVLDESESIRQELISQSARLFRKKGYDNTTVRDIAAAVGIQSGSWFYHFKTKQDILVAVMEQGMQRSLQEIEQLSLADLPARLAFQRLVEVHLNTLLAPDHDFIAVLLYEWRSLDKPARTRIIALKDRYETVWEQAIVALHASGDWAMPTPLDKLLMFGTLNWTAQWYRRGTGISIEELAAQCVQFILRTKA